MPQPSVIIPIIITGLFIGSIIASGDKKISKNTKKRLLRFSLISGLLNAGYGYALYLMFPPTISFRGVTRPTGGGGSELEFVVASFLTGFLIVLATVGIALLYTRYKTRSTSEETEETQETEETEDTEKTQDVDLEKLPK